MIEKAEVTMMIMPLSIW
jgi:hypothetical protein